ncbi:Dabb family protein [Pseudodesulfovibrio tunisiensis]|uniref:Dabb family protein n=1 Tax=Pseudodesulfovibrio tunisiensis TaxID=463192 RepID=UPI001FB3C8E2|nr:Dabb family protein [Pseudodesulfovibrio tunisiensis]
MVRHVVMWTLKDEAEGVSAWENAGVMKKMLEALRGRIPGLLHIEVSREIVAADPECHVVLCSEHVDREALDAYQVHPEHRKCVAFVRKVASGRKAVDYEI